MKRIKLFAWMAATLVAALAILTMRSALGQSAGGAPVGWASNGRSGPKSEPSFEKPIDVFSADEIGGRYGEFGSRYGAADLYANVQEGSSQERKAEQQDAALERQTLALVRRYAKSEDGSERERVKVDLASLVDKHFDVRLGIQEKELLALESRVQRLRQAFERRKSEKETIVSNRVRRLLREADGLGWGNLDPTPRSYSSDGRASIR